MSRHPHCTPRLLAIPVLLAALAGCSREEMREAQPVSAGAGPSAPATGGPPAPVAAARPASAPTAGSAATTGGGGPAGQAVFASSCVACHGAGVAGAPRLGDRADWAPRIAQGREVLYRHAVAGYTGSKGVMPPKGGNASLTDGDVRAAVDYMVAQAR